MFGGDSVMISIDNDSIRMKGTGKELLEDYITISSCLMERMLESNDKFTREEIKEFLKRLVDKS